MLLYFFSYLHIDFLTFLALLKNTFWDGTPCTYLLSHLADPSFPPAGITGGEETPDEDGNTIQFAVLMRKGQKQTLKELAVPKDSDMAVNLLKQEEVQRLEKEKMKKLTLEINERQEEEDLNEAIAMVCNL